MRQLTRSLVDMADIQTTEGRSIQLNMTQNITDHIKHNLHRLMYHLYEIV